MTSKVLHFKTRYVDHFKAIDFAQKKKVEIQNQVNEFLTTFDTIYTLKDLQFLEDISELVIRALRALTYTYPMRFFMKGKLEKKRLFDLLQGNLEMYLEKLGNVIESDWTQQLDYGFMNGDIYEEENKQSVKKPFGQRFSEYKEQVNFLRQDVESHFGKVVNEIYAGHSSFEVGESINNDEEEEIFIKSTTWTCILCTSINDLADPRCKTCKTAAPNSNRR